MSFFNSFNRKFWSATYLQIKKISFCFGCFLIFQKLKTINSELLFPLRGYFWEDGNLILFLLSTLTSRWILGFRFVFLKVILFHVIESDVNKVMLSLCLSSLLLSNVSLNHI